MALNIVLYEPEIPQNTGNIARTCAATGTNLFLIGPLGFSISDRYLKRAGLDYWKQVDVTLYENWQAFDQKHGEGTFFFASTKSAKAYTEVAYPDNCYIVFGPESRGLPEPLLKKNYTDCIRIPMREQIRSLNLSNAVAIVLYEALRQSAFTGLEQEGHLTGCEGS